MEEEEMRTEEGIYSEVWRSGEMLTKNRPLALLQ